MVDLIYFPCGEFRPGEEPRPDPGIPNSIPPIYIPIAIKPTPPFVPGAPDPPRPRPDPRPPTPTPSGPPVTPSATPNGPVTPGPGGPAAAVLGPPGPITPRYFKCQATSSYCPPPSNLPPNGTYSQVLHKIQRRKIPCNARDAQNDFPITRNINTLNPYTPTADNHCIEEINKTFFLGCRDSLVNPCLEGINSAQAEPSRPTSNSSVSRPTTATVNVSQQPNDPQVSDPRANVKILMDSVDLRDNERRVGNSRGVAESILKLIPTKEVETFDINDPQLRVGSSASASLQENRGIYDEVYNFFRTYPTLETRFVANFLYLNIFNDRVAEEVYYFLNRINNILPWNEEFFNRLTNEKLILSIKYELLTAFSNLHTIANTPINVNDFIEIVKSHLIEGTLDQFDPNYYLFIYNSQLRDSTINILPEGESKVALQAAMGIFNNSSQSPDWGLYSTNVRDEYKRMRVLLTDIEANIRTIQLDGNDSSLYLNNAGITTLQIDGNDEFTLLGDGAGYYFSAEYANSSTYPLQSENYLSSSRYLTPITRYTVLRILGADLDINITASSNTHEFSTSYNPSAALEPMYFTIDFESIGDKINPNSTINLLSATYSRVSTEEAVRHSRNYSYNTIKLNLDHNDPIVHYIRDSSSFTYDQDDFNLRAFEDNRTLTGSSIILRNMPAAIIVTPGLGSAHNPFNGHSTILSYDEPVSRSLALRPTFDTANNILMKPPLQASNTFYTVGTPYFGMYERDYDRDYHGNLLTFDPSSFVFDFSYYVNGEYSRSSPGDTYRTQSIESKLTVSTVDRLINVSGVEFLTWWDVFRRLTTNDIGKLYLSNPYPLIRKLSSGWRSSVNIYNVLARAPIVSSGIPSDSTIENDQIIINEVDRVFRPQ